MAEYFFWKKKFFAISYNGRRICGIPEFNIRKFVGYMELFLHHYRQSRAGAGRVFDYLWLIARRQNRLGFQIILAPFVRAGSECYACAAADAFFFVNDNVHIFRFPPVCR